MQCISFLWQLKEMMQGRSCGRVTNLNPHWTHYSDGTNLQLEDVLSQVIDILFHSLGPLSSALSAADWLFQNTKEGTPVNVITTLSEAFGIEGFTISISLSWILKQCIELYKGSAMAFLVDEWMTPDVGNRHQGKILHATANDKRFWVTSKNRSECQRLNANMKKQKDRHSMLPMLPYMATRLRQFVQMTQIFL